MVRPASLAAPLDIARRLGQLPPERRRHLLAMPAYLEAAGDAARLHELLRADIQRDPERPPANLWYTLWSEAGELTGFDEDVRRAWRAADRGGAAGLELRYVLVLASLNSTVATVPPALLAALVRSGEWSQTRALAVARRVPEPERRARMLGALAPVVGQATWEEAVTVARAIDGVEDRAEALVGLALREGSAALVGEALEQVQALKGRRRGELLAGLAATCDAEVTRNLGDWLFGIQYRSDGDVTDNAGLILDVLALAPEPYRARQLWHVVSQLDNRNSWFVPRHRKAGELLARACALLPDSDDEATRRIVQEALDNATQMKDGAGERALAVIARHVPAGLVDVVEAAAREGAADKALAALALRARELGDPARSVALAREVTGPDQRIMTLCALSAELTRVECVRLAAEAAALSYDTSRIQALLALVPQLEDPERSMALAAASESVADAVGSVFHATNPSQFFAELAPVWPEPVARAALAAAVGAERSVRWPALRGLGLVVPERMLGDFVEAVAALDAPDEAAEVYAGIAERLPAPWLRRAYEALTRIGDGNERAAALAALAPWSERSLEAVDAAGERSHETNEELALATAHLLREGRVSAAARLANEVLASGTYAGYTLTKALEPAAHSVAVADLLDFIDIVPDRSDRVRLLVAGLQDRPVAQRRTVYDRALQEARRVSGRSERVASLAQVVAAAPEFTDTSTLRTLRQGARQLRGDAARWHAVAPALAWMPREWAAELTRRVFTDATGSLRDDPHSLRWLSELTEAAARFDLDDATAALVAAVGRVEDGRQRSQFIEAIAPHIGQRELASLDEPARRIADEYSRGRAQGAIAARRAQIGDGRRAMADAEAIAFDTQRKRAMGLVARHLPFELLQEIRLDRDAPSELRAGVAVGLARAGHDDAALNVAGRMASDRVRALQEIVPMLRSVLAEEAVEMVLEQLRNSGPRVRAEHFIQFVEFDELPDSARTALVVATFEAAYAMRDERPSALAGLVRQKPEDGATILRRLAPYLPDLPADASLQAWRAFLAKLSDRSRPVVLVDLSAIVPLLAAVGGTAAVEETFDAIHDVGRWWP